jgi:glycerate 2-kinase
MIDIPKSPAIQDAQAIWKAGIAAVDARQLVREFVSVTPDELRFGDSAVELDTFDRLVVVGGGKASGWMAEGLEQALGEEFLVQNKVIGHVNVPDDQWTKTNAVEVIRCRPAGLNLPTQRVLDSTTNMIELLNGCEPNDLCICLISGGGSALLELPVPPITLDQLRFVTAKMAANGAPIEALNAVRQQISQVKSGGLARAAACRNIVTLIVSDILGDRIDMIASGPTVADPPTIGHHEAMNLAYESLMKYCGPQESAIPQTILDVLKAVPAGSFQTISTNPKQELLHFVIGNNQMAVAAATAKAKKLGYECQNETNSDEGDAEDVAKRLWQKLHQLDVDDPSSVGACIVSGGEPTVELSEAAGRGGRNQHLVLAAILQSLQQDHELNSDFGFLSAGTDGEDGNVPVAGAVFNGELIKQIQNADWRNHIESSLTSHDSHTMLMKLGCIFETPPTRTNVCDLRVVLRRRKSETSYPLI